MTQALAYVNPVVLRWARESAGYDLSEAASKIGIATYTLQAAEEDVEYLTLRQAEAAADVYGRTLATLLRPEPPQEEEQHALFRRLPGTPAPPWPPELRFLARRVRDRQDAVAEIYEELEDEPPWQRTAIALTRPSNDALSLRVRDLLNVSRDEQSSWQGLDNYAPMNGWRDAVERLGALVMQDGSVGLDQMRGFAAVHDAVPAILINSKDDPRARAFTLVHELAHLVFAVTRETVRNPEARANALAAEVIMPEAWFVEEFARTTGDPLDRIQRVSRLFGTTMLATAIRAKSLNVLSSREGEAAVGTLRSRRYIPRSGGGADYYRTAVSRLGPSFIDIVFNGLDSEVVTYTEAVSLLGNVKVEKFERLRDQAHGRVGSE